MLGIRLAGARSIKGLKDMRKIFFSDAFAAIPDSKHGFRLFPPQRQRNLILGVGML